MQDIFRDLNPEQKAAVEATEGYVRVIAGAGSGKTRALAARYVHITKNLGISNNRILCVTFTNKAANEMKQRIRKYAQADDCGYVCTFHGFCAKLLREDIHVVNYPKQFSITDTEDQKSIVRRCFEKLGLTLSDYEVKKSIDYISRIKTTRLGYVEMVTAPDENALPEAFQNSKTRESRIFYLYLMEQRKSFVLDFDDLMSFALYILEKDESVRSKWQKRLQYIMVDEFQDVSRRQYALACILSDFHKNLFVVGDPDQIIYTWRGARPGIILNFDQKFPGTKTILMEQNYRSSVEILAAANDLIRKNTNRVEKNLVPILGSHKKPVYFYALTRDAQARWVADQIQSMTEQGVKPRDIAVLYRSHYLSRSIEEYLIKAKIPYKIYNGMAFYQRKEIKDVHCYLRFMLMKDDLSFRRIVNTPLRKFGKKSIANLESIAEREHCSLWDALLSCVTIPIPGVPATPIQNFIALVEKYSKLTDELLISEFMQSVLHDSGYEEMLQTQGDQERLNNLAELKQAIIRFENEAGEDVTLQDYLEHIALFTSGDENDTDAVKIMTIHSAKGLEFPYVFVYEMSEGVFPSANATTKAVMEEERRLAYVAFTRAEKELFLSSSAGDNLENQYRKPSRFIFNAERDNLHYAVELPEDVLEDAMDYIIDSERRLAAMESTLLPDGARVYHRYFGNGVIVGRNEREMTYNVRFEKIPTERTISFETELRVLEESDSGSTDGIEKEQVFL